MPEMRNQITLGNLIQIAVTLATVAIAAGGMSMAVNSQSKSIADHEVRLRLLESRISSSLARIELKLEIIEGDR